MMYSRIKNLSCFPVLAVLVMVVCSCQPGSSVDEQKVSEFSDSAATIGSFAELWEFGAVPVKGFGIVAGLPGTGSSECPAKLRAVLSKYIQQQVSRESKINPDKFIDSKDTAVVSVYGVIPAVASSGQFFDVKIVSIPNTQTTSLAGGRLFPTELKAAARLALYDLSVSIPHLRTLATAHGPVFIDKPGEPVDETSGYVLAGGAAVESAKISLVLFEENFTAASVIRNRLIERFGRGTAYAISQSEVQVTVPQRYRRQKDRFLAMVRSLSLGTSNQLQQRRIDELVENLAGREDKLSSEIALVGIGNASLVRLAPLLEADDESVRFHAARCMLDIGDDRGLRVLRAITRDADSAYRTEAAWAIGRTARRNDAIPVLSRLLSESDFNVRFAAYEELRKLEDISVSQMFVARDFFVDSIVHKGPKVIFVSRRGIPRIVLFGAPISCEQNIFVESAKRNITINAQPGDKYVSIMRKHPTLPKLVGPLQSSFDLTGIIRTLCESSIAQDNVKTRPGLGVSYSDLIALLEQMCQDGAIKAEFRAGPMTIVEPNVKKTTADGR